MFKKNLMVLISLILILSLTACAGGSAVNNSSDGGNSSVSSDSGFSTDLKSQIQNCTPIVDYEKNTSVDQIDTVTFGTDSRGEPIEWIVLEKEGYRALLLSKYLLVSHEYNNLNVDITWEESTCRKWLNSDFIKQIFSEKEQESIMISYVHNNDNTKYNTKGGNDTQDRIFLLSIREVNKYFNGSVKLIANYKNGAKDSWWLRSPDVSQKCAAAVNKNGYPSGGGNVGNSRGIRPAIWVIY